MHKLLVFFLFAFSLSATVEAQIVYTPPVAPQAATPAKLVVSGGTSPNSVSCTVTGNAVPATSLTFACTVLGVSITPYTIPFTTGSAYTLQHNIPNVAVTIIANGVNLPGTPINVSATVNGGTAVGGPF